MISDDVRTFFDDGHALQIGLPPLFDPIFHWHFVQLIINIFEWTGVKHFTSKQTSDDGRGPYCHQYHRDDARPNPYLLTSCTGTPCHRLRCQRTSAFIHTLSARLPIGVD